MAKKQYVYDGSAWVEMASSISTLPPGFINQYAGALEPTGWLFCQGQQILISAYTNLYNVLTANGTVFPYGANTNGSGSAGSTHFRIPDFRGRVPMGAGTGNQYDGSKADIGDLSVRALGDYVSNAETVTLTAAQSGVPAHSHANTVSGTFASSTHYHGVNSNFTAGYFNGNGFKYTQGETVVSNGTTNTGANDNSASVSITNVNNTAANAAEAHTNIQPSTVINFIIKT